MKVFFNIIHNRDIAILRIFNNSIRCSFLDLLMPPITYLGSLTFMLFFCAATLFNKNPIIHLYSLKCIIALSLSAVITQIIKKNVNRVRPFITLDNLYIKKIGIDKYSFPSGHTCASFSIAMMTYFFFPHLFIYSLILSILVGISRMYLGVHYPTDVFIGMIIGITTSIVVFKFIFI